jgi:hypothetical protein
MQNPYGGLYSPQFFPPGYHPANYGECAVGLDPIHEFLDVCGLLTHCDHMHLLSAVVASPGGYWAAAPYFPSYGPADVFHAGQSSLLSSPAGSQPPTSSYSAQSPEFVPQSSASQGHLGFLQPQVRPLFLLTGARANVGRQLTMRVTSFPSQFMMGEQAHTGARFAVESAGHSRGLAVPPQ